MGAARSRQVAEAPVRDRPQDASQVVEFAAERLLRDRPAPGALQAVLRRLAACFDARAALVLQRPADGKLNVAAAYPRQAAADPAMLATISALRPEQQRAAAGEAIQVVVSAPRLAGSSAVSALLTCAEPSHGQPPCIVALIGDASSWTSRAKTKVRAVASIVAAQMRHAAHADELAGQQEQGAARFRRLAQLAPVGIVQTDAAGRIMFANDRWCALTGLTEREAVGSSWTRAVHPGDVDRIARERAYAFEHGAELRTDCRLRPSRGEEIWVQVTVAALTGPDGELTGAIAALADISGRKRQEAERARLLDAEHQARRSLAGQTERLQSLIAAAIPGVLFTDEHGMISQLNRSFCDLFGLDEDPGQLAGTPVADLVRRIKQVFADPAEFVRRTGDAFMRRQPASGQQMPCADGRTFECDYWPVRVGGDYRGDLWLAWDMSGRKAMEDQTERLLGAELAARVAAERSQQELAEQNFRLRKADEEKTHYLANVSRELRTPLVSIASFTEVIRRGEEVFTPDTEDALGVIQSNAERLLNMVAELTLLSRIEAGVMPLELAPVSVPALVKDAAESASSIAAQRGIEIKAAAQDGPAVHGDQIRLRQVFDNLIANAVQFSRKGGLVRVTASHDDHVWTIEVQDKGIGVPPEELGKIFGRFVRGSNARTAGLPGTGLGLAVVKAITELHSGHAEAHSTPKGGTIFRIRLPLP